MTDSVDDDFFFRNLIEDKKGIRWRSEAANDGIFRADANVRVSREQFDHVLDALLNAHCARGETAAM
jgi:hypothetical protein